jgi:hypothetical protein
MKARIGDYIKFKDPQSGDEVVSKVVFLNDLFAQYHLTESGHYISEDVLGIDDVLLESEMEIG